MLPNAKVKLSKVTILFAKVLKLYKQNRSTNYQPNRFCESLCASTVCKKKKKIPNRLLVVIFAVTFKESVLKLLFLDQCSELHDIFEYCCLLLRVYHGKLESMFPFFKETTHTYNEIAAGQEAMSGIHSFLLHIERDIRTFSTDRSLSKLQFLTATKH